MTEKYFNVEEIANKFPTELLDNLLMAAPEMDFYGIDNNSFCLGVGGSKICLEALEDPSDGYRSYFGCFRTTDVDKIFFRDPIARVKMVEVPKSDGGAKHFYSLNIDINGWQLVDLDDGHVWLVVGTDFSDDYYPFFVFRYEPKR